MSLIRRLEPLRRIVIRGLAHLADFLIWAKRTEVHLRRPRRERKSDARL